MIATLIIAISVAQIARPHCIICVVAMRMTRTQPQEAQGPGPRV